ncbi:MULTISPECIES: acyl-CoA dehydrogenase family protein [Sporomusa]|jgi:butyryl-CoA dehydrogenase|uniref:acyl-CoA dehydrogenase family protein n=1 Tax=Sporomusa TaxID=2375 RepID=UPI002030ECB5|nr:acyl-CoA dehydrogenase family protein [Sporomusa sphaeroides]MCM0758657.1 acyl-CoA dehydrogenase family protein [Sporomusa sphaeroides DSM 2875]HML33960.1 acyl-CoA dehydrogenase family protein [Sporomusa sphaeroides]
MEFKYTEEQQDFKNTVHDYAVEVLAPRAVDIDKNNEFPLETIKELAKYDLMGIAYPEELGGVGADAICEAIAVEEITYGCAATASILTGHYLGFDALFLRGNDEQKRNYLTPAIQGEKLAAFCLTEPDSGSDAGSSRTTAVRDGDYYILNGSKHFITNAAYADFMVAFAMTDKAKKTRGMTAFVIEKGMPGMTIGAGDDKMGIRGARTHEVIFEDCRVPVENRIGEENEGFKIAMQVIDRGRIGIAAMGVGLAQAALDAAVKYAKDRVVFSNTLSNYQGIQWMLAEMATDVEAARWLTYYAADLKESGKKFSKEAAMAKLFTAEASHRVVHKALQIHGGYGYMKEYPIERMYRDQRILEIFEGTSQIQKIVISNHLLR